jgi:hypothetical protein
MKAITCNFVKPHPGEIDLEMGVRSFEAERCLSDRLTYWTSEKLAHAMDTEARSGWVRLAYAAEILRRDAARKAGAL